MGPDGIKTTETQNTEQREGLSHETIVCFNRVFTGQQVSLRREQKRKCSLFKLI